LALSGSTVPKTDPISHFCDLIFPCNGKRIGVIACIVGWKYPVKMVFGEGFLPAFSKIFRFHSLGTQKSFSFLCLRWGGFGGNLWLRLSINIHLQRWLKIGETAVNQRINSICTG